jgi:nicotinamidase/pyrazinamidase
MYALLVIDIQKDFLPGGSLAVEHGDEIIPVVNTLQDSFDLVVATQDWHPRDHGSFASCYKGKNPGDIVSLDGVDQILWPDHCVQHSEGAEFADDLNVEKISNIIRKGTDNRIDSYSGFYDNKHKKATGLHDYLQEKKVDTVFITGLATDFCVQYTTLDALGLKYKTYLVKDLTRAVGGEKAFNDTIKILEQKGAKIVHSDHVIKLMERIGSSV